MSEVSIEKLFFSTVNTIKVIADTPPCSVRHKVPKLRLLDPFQVVQVVPVVVLVVRLLRQSHIQRPERSK